MRLMIHFFHFCYKDQKISTTDAKDTSFSTVYGYFQLSTVSSASFSLHDILSSMFIVTLAQNVNDSLCHTYCKTVKCVWCICRYVYLFIVPIQKIAFLNIQVKCTSSILQVITRNFRFKLQFILQLSILFLSQVSSQPSFFKLLKKKQITQMSIFI